MTMGREHPGTITLRTSEGSRDIPVFSVRDGGHRVAIARTMADHRMAAFYGGVYGVIKGIRAPSDDHPDDAEVYWQLKPDRPRTSKLPMFIRPVDAMPLVDFDALHPDFRRLSDASPFEALWTSHGGPLHVIVPLRDPIPELHPAFQTSAVGIAEPTVGSERVEAANATASLMWMADPAWDDVARLIDESVVGPLFFGVSSFNDHGEHPPYTFDELVAFLDRKTDLPIELIVNDELFEASGAHSSHTQVRLPLVGESPELVLVRHGGVSPAWLTEATGYPVRVPDGTPRATRPERLDDAELRQRLDSFRTERGP